MQVNDKLKPCPFCGGDVELSIYSDDGEDMYFIECTNHTPKWYLGKKIHVTGYVEMCSHGIGEDSRKALIEAWNTRAELTFPDEVQEAQYHLCEMERITGETWRPERTCTFSKYEKAGDPYPTCSACGYETDWHECECYFDGTFEYKKNFCPNCGSKVIRNAD